MFKSKELNKYIDIDITNLKKLKLFESIDSNWNELGFQIIYTRVPGGLIRLVINTEAIDQIFIPVSPQWFMIN